MKITTINSIEVSSLCNLKCPYCPAKDQAEYRPVGLMEREVFEKALEWVDYFRRQGTQKELNLFGVGEPLLHPGLVDMIELARKCLPPKLPIHINTNGKVLTSTLALRLKAVGITNIDVTGHDAYHTAKAIRILRKVGIPGNLSVDFMTMPNNWAGQVEWFESEVRYPCPWLHKGQVMIMSNGAVTTCCFDAFAQGVVGTVWGDLSKIELAPFKLCETCHQDVPQSVIIQSHVSNTGKYLQI